MDNFLKQIIVNKLEIKYINQVLEELSEEKNKLKLQQDLEENKFREKVNLYNEIIKPEKESKIRNILIWGSVGLTIGLVLGLMGLMIIKNLSILKIMVGFISILLGNGIINFIGDRLITSYFKKIKRENYDVISDLEEELKEYWSKRPEYQQQINSLDKKIKNYGDIEKKIEQENLTLLAKIKEPGEFPEEIFKEEAKDRVYKLLKQKENSSF